MAVSVIVVTFAIIGFGISLLLIKNCDHGRRNSSCEVRKRKKEKEKERKDYSIGNVLRKAEHLHDTCTISIYGQIE